MGTVKLNIETDPRPLAEVGHQMGEISKEANEVGRDVSNAFRKSTVQADAFDKEIKETSRDLDKLQRQSSVPQAMGNNFRKAGDDVKKANKEVSELDKQLGSLKTNLQAAFSIAAVGAFVNKILETRSEFQKFEAVLTNTLGSKSVAQGALKEIQEVAAKTPFSVAELTASFVKLANQGFEPTKEQIVKLGDLAASQGKSFDQLAEGLLDAQTGEFERLKEFGIKTRKEGDNVKFTFKGVETQVKNNSKAIQGYIVGLGDLQGVSGGMAAISDTLGGKISNLGDNFDAFFNNLGESSEGVFGLLLDGFNSLLGSMNETSSKVLEVTRALKGTSGEFDFLDKLAGVESSLVPFQQGLNAVQKFGKEAKNIDEVKQAYETYGQTLKSIQKSYDEGLISLEQFNRFNILIAKSAQGLDESRKHILDNQKKDEEAARNEKLKADKAAFEKLKAAREAFEKGLLDIRKRVQKAELELAEPEEKIKLQRQFDNEEIDELQKHFVKLGKAKDSNFKLSLEQEQQFALLRKAVNEKSANDLIELAIKTEKEIAKARQTAAKGALDISNIDEQNQISAVNLTQNSAGIPEVDFELSKQKRILDIQREFASKKLALREEGLAAENAVFLKEADSELKQLEKRTDAESELRRKNILANVDLTQQKFAAEKEAIQNDTAELINNIQSQRDKLDEKQGFDLAKFLGVNAENIQNIELIISKMAESISSSLDQQIDAYQKVIQESEKRQQQIDKEIEDLQGKLETEKEIGNEGLANNQDRIRSEIALKEEQKAKEKELELKAIEERKKVQKEKLLLDTIAQGSNLFLAATEIYAKAAAATGPAGVPIAIAAIGAMLTAFVVQKASALKAIEEGNGFKEGVFDLKGPGTGTSDSIDARLSKGESVMRAKTTEEHWDLLKALHENDEIAFNRALLNELAGTGVTLSTPPSELYNKREQLRKQDLISLMVDNSKMEKELTEIKKNQQIQISASRVKNYIDQNGNMINKFGSHTSVVRKK